MPDRNPTGIHDDAAAPVSRPPLGTLWRRKGMIVLVALLGMVATTLVGLGITPMYTATAEVMIEPRQTNVVGFQSVLAGLSLADPAIIETETRVLASRNFARRVFEELGLARNPEFRVPAEPAEPEQESLVAMPWRRALAWLPERWLVEAGLVEKPALERLKAREVAAAPAARDDAPFPPLRNLKVSQEGRSNVIAVSFSSISARTAQEIVNGIVNLYVQEQIERKRAAAIKASGWLGERVAALKGDVARAEAAVQEYRVANGLAGDRRTDVNDEQVADLNKQLIVDRAELAGRQARLAFIKELRQRRQALDTLPEVLGSPVIVQLRQQEAEMARSEANLVTSLGSRHPQMQLVIAERRKLDNEIAGEIDRVVANLENEARIVAAKVDMAQAGLDAAQRTSSQAQVAEVRLGELQSEALAVRKLYEEFLKRLKETTEQQAIVEPDARIISLAGPGQPSSPKPSLFAAMGLVLFALIGTMLALALDRLDKGLRSAGEVRAALGLARSGLVPSLGRVGRWRRPHHYMLQNPLSVYTESIRGVLNALHRNGDQSTKLVLITSSVPGEGKTMLAVSLATYAASIGHRVILLDLDLRHPNVARELGLSASTGIVEHLVHEVPLDEVIEHDPRLSLDVITACEHTVDPMPLLASRQMDDLLLRLRSDYDYVIVDSPPLLGVTDAQLLAPLVDKVLLVVRWARTTGALAASAAALLRDAGSNIAGVVLTQVDLEKHARYGYDDIGTGYVRYTKYYHTRPAAPGHLPLQERKWLEGSRR